MIARITFILFTGIFLFGSMVSPVDARFLDNLKNLGKKLEEAVKDVTKTVDERSQSIDYSRSPVHEVQELLYKLGYYAGPVDGVLNEKTAQAIKAFKRDNNMHVDGQITDSLIIALRNANNPDRLGHGSSGTVQFDTPRTMPGGTNFDNAPEPDYRTLFKMYMASQGDILDTEALALEYHLLFRVRNSEECKEIRNIYSSNSEFEIEDLMDSMRPPFTQALLDARDWPKTKVFRLKATVVFGKYDREKRKFPIKKYGLDKLALQGVDRNSGSNPPCREISHSSSMLFNAHDRKIPLALSGLEKIKSLPMEEARAESFLKKFKKDIFGGIRKKLDIEVLVQVGPVPFYTRGRRGGIPARVTAARLLYPEDGRVLHTYNTSLFEPAVAEATSGTKAYNLAAPDDAVHLTTLSATILILRDHPQLIEDDWALGLVKRQIATEQWLWKDIDKALLQFRKEPEHEFWRQPEHDDVNINKKRPAFIYEWQTLVKEQPNLANGPVLDVFWQPDPDWSFVKQEKEWDDRLEAIVSVFLFSRDKIVGRDPEFLARELLPVWKRHLDAVLAKKPPERMSMSGFFAEPKYDFDTQSLQLPNYNKKTGKSYLFTPIVFPDSSLGNIVLPQSVRTFVLYRLVYGKHPESRTTTPGSLMKFHYGPRYSPGKWRSIAPAYNSSGWNNSPMDMPQVLALDRRLEFTSISVAASEAEDLLDRIRRARQRARQKRKGDYSIEARLIFEPVRTELGTVVQQYPIHKKGTTKPSPILFGRVIRVDLLMADGQLITSLGPDDFPSAESLFAAAQERAEEEKSREARYDILGIRVGMPVSQAEKLIRKHMDVKWVYEYTNPFRKENRPTAYPYARIFVSQKEEYSRFGIYDQNRYDIIALYLESADTQKVLAIWRSFPAEQSNSEAIEKALEQKYGKYIDTSPHDKAFTHLKWGNTSEQECCSFKGLYSIGGGIHVRNLKRLEGPGAASSSITATPAASISSCTGNFTPHTRIRDLSCYRECGPVVEAIFRKEKKRSLWIVYLYDHSVSMAHFVTADNSWLKKEESKETPDIDIKF